MIMWPTTPLLAHIMSNLYPTLEDMAVDSLAQHQLAAEQHLAQQAITAPDHTPGIICTLYRYNMYIVQV